MDEMSFTTQGARRAVPWTQLHDWVRISGVSPVAASLYWVIKMHVYVRAGDNTVKASADTLASFCGLSRGDKILRYVRELEEIGALSSKRLGMPARKIYTVHEEPPDGYTGPLTLKEWYAMRKAVLALKNQPVDNSVEPQVSPVTPSGGEQADDAITLPAKPQVSPVTPSGGGQPLLPPGGGNSVTPSGGGHIQEVGFEQEDLTAPPPAAADGYAGATVEDQQEKKILIKTDPPRDTYGLTDWELSLVDECLRLRPDWSPVRLREILTDPDVRDRPDRDLVRRAFLIGARTQRTQPGRMTAAGCPHWTQALTERRKEQNLAEEDRPVSSDVPRPRPPKVAEPDGRTLPASTRPSADVAGQFPAWLRPPGRDAEHAPARS